MSHAPRAAATDAGEGGARRRRARRLGGIALAALVVGAGRPALAQEEEENAAPAHEFAVAPWNGSAFYSADGEVFSHCLMAAQFDRQMSLVIALDGLGGASVGVRNPRWSLALMEQQPLSISLGGAADFEQDATAVDTSLLLVRFADGEAMLDEIARASLVTVAQGSQSFQFVMVNGAQGIAALRACAEAARGVLDPDAPPPRPTLAELDQSDQPAAPEPDGREETILVDPVALDQTVARNFLGAAGLDDFTLLTEDEQADFLGDARAAWTNGAVYGALYTIAPRVLRLDRAMEQALDLLEEGCAGVFTWAPIIEAVQDDNIARRASVCDETEFAMLFRLAVINGESGTLVIVHGALREDAGRLASAEDQLIAAIRESGLAIE